jgi:chromosomal replication initiation ATPase DnaA
MQTAVAPPLPSTTAAGGGGLGPRLISFAERWFDIPAGAIQNPKRRSGNITKARQALAHVLNTECGWSYPRIAKLFHLGGHASVFRGARQAEKLLRSDEIFFEGVKLLKAEIAPQ